MMVRVIFGKEDLMSVGIPICIIPGNENMPETILACCQLLSIIIKFRLLKKTATIHTNK